MKKSNAKPSTGTTVPPTSLKVEINRMALELATQRWGEQGTPLVILHGLLGAGRNWQTIGSQMAEEFQVIAPDLRNHGQSPHSERMTYADLVEDVLALVRKLERPVHLLGHSLGGKVAMRAALAEPAAFASLTVVDMAPVTMAIRLKPVLNAVCELRIEDKTSRAEVDAELQTRIADSRTRLFLLSNLAREGKTFRWRPNVRILRDFLPELGSFEPPPCAIFERPSLFMRGGNSDYVSEAGIAAIPKWFSQATVHTVEDAGHWVHIDQPIRVVAELRSFLSGTI